MRGHVQRWLLMAGAAGMLLCAVWFRSVLAACMLLMLLTCGLMLLRMERRSWQAGELVVLAVLVAMTVAGRLAFAWTQSIKPVAAFVILTGLYLGRESGFLCGALGALLSNCYFGQGMWTPFQMLSWGLIGYGAGMLARYAWFHKLPVLLVYGALSGIFFSLVMDIWTVLSAQGEITLARYGAAVLTAVPVTALYAVSNVLFLLALTRPVGRRLTRICTKYGLFIQD